MLTIFKNIYLLMIPAIIFSGCGLQRKMLYYPGDLSNDELIASGLKFWPSKKDYRGLISANEVNDRKGVVIVFHGNAGAAVHRGYYINFLEPFGYNHTCRVSGIWRAFREIRGGFVCKRR